MKVFFDCIEEIYQKSNYIFCVFIFFFSLFCKCKLLFAFIFACLSMFTLNNQD